MNVLCNDANSTRKVAVVSFPDYMDYKKRICSQNWMPKKWMPLPIILKPHNLTTPSFLSVTRKRIRVSVKYMYGRCLT